MATCPKCKHEIVSVTHGSTTRLLDPVPLTYRAVDLTHLYPQDGDQVVLAEALVDHTTTCRGEWRERTQAREQGKAAYQRQKGTKA